MDRTLQIVAAFIGVYTTAHVFYAYVFFETYFDVLGFGSIFPIISLEDLIYFDARGSIVLAFISSIGLLLCFLLGVFGLDESNAAAESTPKKNTFFLFRYLDKLINILVIWIKRYSIIKYIIYLLCVLLGIIVYFQLNELPSLLNIYLIVNFLIPIIAYGFVKNKKSLYVTYWIISFVVAYFIVTNILKDHKIDQSFKMSFVYKGQKRGRNTAENLVFYGHKTVVTMDTLNQVRIYPSDQISDVTYSVVRKGK